MRTTKVQPYIVMDVNIENTSISDYVVFEDEFIVHLNGGNGMFLDLETQTVAHVENLEEVTMTFKVGTLAHDLTHEYVSMLASWKNSSTLLTLLGSPHDPFLLVANDEEWIAVPRSSNPQTS